ncbi:hypothetical protein PCANC_20815 [Puccinia coronata f. sp. avenae]|uniref:DUF6589 domain-containing protein n=1 Tax=Puccinia coronata f. sp. avenae TaxID=200324 RepID=A0A2N5TSF9_9BASI|nr:hypothetical protein PCANC_20815 [Puccinia coronata f. sp. avenae]
MDHISKDQKALEVCLLLRTLPNKMTPKVFFQHFLQSPHSDLASLRRFWAQPTGIESTMQLVQALRKEITKTEVGVAAWGDFIQNEAINIASKQQPKRGNYPHGSFQSSTTVAKSFFSTDEKETRETILTTEQMPFLYNTLLQTLLLKAQQSPTVLESEDEEPVDGMDLDVIGVSGEADFFCYTKQPAAISTRFKKIASTICSMVAFACNRCANGFQLTNSVRFLACGVSDRVHDYLHYLGLTSSKRTALSALNRLALNAKYNLDMEQKVHDLSVGNRSHTFRESIRGLESLVIEPAMLLPTAKENITSVAVWNSQIARVLMNQLTVPKDKKINSDVPPADNSAEGIGQVFEAVFSQTGLSINEFFGRVLPMDGDLGTVQNFNCLQAQRSPNPYPQESLSNTLFQLGASHTLWNIASAIFTLHIGNPKDARDCGAWQYLEALGFPSEKAIQKKDFTLMINQMERVFESILYYCLREIIENRQKGVSDSILRKKADAKEPGKKGDSNALPVIETEEWNSIVEDSKRSMRDGDVGRLMIIWSKWSLMTQALPGITNYSTYLPRAVLLLTVILPPDMRKYLRHNLLITPTGRDDHFLSKDGWLEVQNYWLKHFYNDCGNGTQIDWLCNIYSPNIMMLQKLLRSLKIDSGEKMIYQSHKNKLEQRSLDMVTLMANNHDVLDKDPNNGTSKNKIENTC